GPGVNGSDRVTFTWPDGAVRNAWLHVTIPATNTGLAAPDVFYFGNLVGDGNDSGAPTVNVSDVAATRANAGSVDAAASSRYDFNRDGVVDFVDVSIVRNNLRLALAPVNPPA